MKPCPSDLPQTINPEAGPKRAGVETHRNLNCHHYDNCLDEAVRRGWQSFSCMKCPLYQQRGSATDGHRGLRHPTPSRLKRRLAVPGARAGPWEPMAQRGVV